MNREGMFLFANLFNSKGNVENPQTRIEVTATSWSQPHVLREKMKEQNMTHGETVKATISPVRLESIHGQVNLYFCPMQTMEIHERIVAGDGDELPANVTLEGLNVSAGQKPGLYTLKNVTISSNGTMQVVADETTILEAYSDVGL